MAGAANIHKGYPGHSTTSWFPVRVGGHAQISLTAQIIDTVIVPFDCIIRQVFLSAVEYAAGATNLTLATLDSTALTIVATISAVANTTVALQTLHADVDGVEIVAGNAFQTKITTDGDSITNFQWTLMLEATR